MVFWGFSAHRGHLWIEYFRGSCFRNGQANCLASGSSSCTAGSLSTGARLRRRSWWSSLSSSSPSSLRRRFPYLTLEESREVVPHSGGVVLTVDCPEEPCCLILRGQLLSNIAQKSNISFSINLDFIGESSVCNREGPVPDRPSRRSGSRDCKTLEEPSKSLSSSQSVASSNAAESV